MIHVCAHRVGGGDTDVAVLLFQINARSGQSAARANGAGEAIYLAVGLTPNFRPRRLNMRLPVGDIVELIGPNRTVFVFFGQFSGQSAGIFDVIIVIGIRNGRHFNQFSSGQTQHVLFFIALRFRNNNDGFIAKRIGDQRNANACISCCTFDNRAARFQQAFGFCVANNEQGSTVFNGLAGVHKLGFAQNRAAGLFRGLFQLN